MAEIPAEAVRAALDALEAEDGNRTYFTFPEMARVAVEAAAPHLAARELAAIPAEHEPLTPQQVIAQAFHHIASEEVALEIADDAIRALQATGHRIIQGEIPAEIRLLTAVRTAVDDSGIRQVHLSRTLGLTTKHMSALLTGKTPLSVAWADRIVAACGLTLDIRISGDGDRRCLR